MFPNQLNSQIVRLLEEMQAKGAPPVQMLSPQEARETRNPVLKELGGVPEPVEKVENKQIPGPAGTIPVRIYSPEGEGPFPVFVFFHGGGYVIGNLDTHDAPCRAIANRAACIVVSVDYRLAPENKFPAAAEDAYAATLWVAENAKEINGNPKCIAVGGDSAGGNLAAVVCLMARDKKGPPLKYQVLIYPIANLASFDTQSYGEHAEGYLLTREGMIYYRNHYIGKEEDAQNPYASPLLADDLSDLPPALMIAAEFDVLKDEGKAYVDRLNQAGVSVEYRLYDDMIHAFYNMAGVVDRTKDAFKDIAARLRFLK